MQNTCSLAEHCGNLRGGHSTITDQTHRLGYIYVTVSFEAGFPLFRIC